MEGSNAFPRDRICVLDSILAKKKEEGNRITKVQIANHLGVSQQIVSSWSKTEKYPELIKALELGDFLECSVHDIWPKKRSN